MHWSSDGRPIADVLADLRSMQVDDVNWREGRTFGLVFDGGSSVREVAERAAMMYAHENAINPNAFPSLQRLHTDVIDWTARLVTAPPGYAGFLTSGGSESIQCAILAARERSRVDGRIVDGEIVVPSSAHAAFHKAAHMFDMKIHVVPVGDDWAADVAAMAEVVNDRTIMVVGSAPQHAQGIVDPIAEIAALAKRVGASCHVDACTGGFVLPFAERLGREVPPWDFRVDGVDSISVDHHKLGYAPKGVSALLYRTRERRRYRTWTFDRALGSLYGAPNLQGTRSAAAWAGAWAVIEHLGWSGFEERMDRALVAADTLRAGVAQIDGLRVLGNPQYTLVAIAPDRRSPVRVQVHALCAALADRGWHLAVQADPDALHATVSNSNAYGLIDFFLRDLAACVAEVDGIVATSPPPNYSSA